MQGEEAETLTAGEAPANEEVFGPHPLFLPLIRRVTADGAAANATSQPSWDEAAEADLAAESVTEMTAIVLVSEPTDASLVGEEASSATPTETTAEKTLVTEALPLRLFLPVVQR